MRSVHNNRTTVCHLAIPREVIRLLWHGEEIECEVKERVISLSQGGLKIPRHREFVAQVRGIMQEKSKNLPHSNGQFFVCCMNLNK